jgi:hypothetical protein
MRLPYSITVRRGACVGKAGARGGLRTRSEPKASERGSEGDGTEPSRREKKSILRLRYKIDNHTCYIGNRVPSPKHETNQYYRRERAWGTGIHV